jgi:hypothetical protein
VTPNTVAEEHATAGAAMSRSFYDIDPAGEVLCTYTEGGEKEKLKSVSLCPDGSKLSPIPLASSM